MIRYCTIPTPLGIMTAVSENGSLTGLHLLPVDLPQEAVCQEDAVTRQVKNWLRSYFLGEQPDMVIPLMPKGTPFQQSVWKILCDIPYGKTVTYGEIASKLANPRMSPQAVGQAVGRNPIAILIPCHRVLGAGGRLTGYAGGLDKKRILLDLEQIEYR